MADIAGLQGALLDEIEQVAASGAAVSVLCREIGQMRPVFNFFHERRMASSSMVVVPMLLAALEQVCRGNLALEQRLPVKQEEIYPGSRVFEGGPRECSLEELLVWMVSASDVTSAGKVMELLGMDEINRYCSSLGLAQTRVRRRLMEAGRPEDDNHTSAGDMDRLYRQLCSDMLLNETMSSKALSILWRQRDCSMLRRNLWEEVGIAHKTATAEFLSHDAGVLFVNGRKVYLGVFVEDAQSPRGEPEFIGRLARLVYDYYMSL